MSSRRHRAVSRKTAAPTPPVIDPTESWATIGLAGLFGLLALVLYLATAARDIVLGDSAEFVTIAVTLGVAHPPGYPLATLLAHLLTVIAPGPIPFRANLLSVLPGAATVAVTYLLGYRLSASRAAAAASAIVVALQPLVWEWSLVAEVFALNAFLAALTLYWLFRWDLRPVQSRWLILAAVTFGLGAANQHTIVFLIPAIILCLWWHRSTLLARPAVAAGATAALLPGLSTYALLLWTARRDEILNWGNLRSIGDLVHHFLRSSYGTFQLADFGQSGRLSDRLGLLLDSFTTPEALLVGLGVLLAMLAGRSRLADRAGRAGLILGLSALGAGPVFAAMANLDPRVPGQGWVLARFFVLPHVLVAPFAAVAVAAALRFADRAAGSARALAVNLAAAALLVGLAAWGIWQELPWVDQRNNHLARTFGEDALASMPPHAVLLVASDAVDLPVAYLQAVEGVRPDVTLVMLGPLSMGDWYSQELRAHDPGLHVPFDRYDSAVAATSLRALVDANPSRPFAVLGITQDTSLEPTYWFLPHGLALLIEPHDREISLAAMDEANAQLFARYRLPPPGVASHTNFDPYILRAYAAGARFVGLQYAAAQRAPEALTWLKRALAIDPTDTTTESFINRLSR